MKIEKVRSIPVIRICYTVSGVEKYGSVLFIEYRDSMDSVIEDRLLDCDGNRLPRGEIFDKVKNFIIEQIASGK